MTAYIQNGMKGWTNQKTAIQGLSELGHWVELVDVVDSAIIGEHIYYGNVVFIRQVIDKLGYIQKWIGHVPEDLYPLAGRNIQNIPLGRVIKDKIHKFIKPTPDKNKSFNGFVYTGNQLEQLYIVNYFANPSEEVIVSDVVNFVSEWRCYMCNGEILDGKHYKGDFKIFPNYGIAENAAKMWKNSPAAWSCDLGITDDGETFIVECNDVMSLGVYGLSPMKLAKMLEVRWEEIHKNKSM